MNIVGFSGSPHKNGNTSWAIETIMEGAKQNGAQTTMFNFADNSIEPCRGCFNCKSSDNGCIIQDDMQKVYAELIDADIVILGSPIYMGQVTAQAKIFIDRLFPTNSPKFSPYYKEQTIKKLLLVFTQGNPDKTMFSTYFDYTKQMFEVLGYEVKDIIVIAGTRSAPAKDMAGLDETLRIIGSKLK